MKNRKTLQTIRIPEIVEYGLKIPVLEFRGGPVDDAVKNKLKTVNVVKRTKGYEAKRKGNERNGKEIKKSLDGE